jgi:hypothetical protein
MTSRLTPGSLVYVRYQDHVLFRDMNPETVKPFTRECVGWLDYEDPECVRVVWERFAMPDPPNESKPKATGLVILKKAILELRKIA